MPATIHNLLEVSETEKNAILKHYNMTEKDFDEIVQILIDWYEKTPLPPAEHLSNKIKMVLLNCKMDMEKSKRTVENYYKLRSNHSYFFDRLLVNTEEYQLAKSLAKTAVMPKLTPDLCRITIFRIDNPQANAPDGLIYELVTFLGIEFRIFSSDWFYSNILIIDLQGIGLKNVLKYTPNVCNVLINSLLSVNLRLKNIHFVNLPPVFEKIISLVKFFLPAHFYSKVRTHQTFESLYEYIPKEYLPSNYGGTQTSIEEIQDKWCEVLESKEEEFKKLLKAKAPESMLTSSIQSKESLDMEGSFRKLAVD